jgi:hypothetical protein
MWHCYRRHLADSKLDLLRTMLAWHEMTLREASARLRSFFRKQELDLELDEELAAHIDLATSRKRESALKVAIWTSPTPRGNTRVDK